MSESKEIMYSIWLVQFSGRANRHYKYMPEGTLSDVDPESLYGKAHVFSKL